MMKKLSVFFCSVLSYAGSVYANVQSDTPFSALEHNINQTKAIAGLASGTSVIVIQEDKVIYSGNFGYADIDKKVKATSDTPYYIASVTKPFMALNVLLDQDTNELHTSTNLTSMFPQIKIDGVDASKVQIKHLMTHTGAINNSPLVLATAYSGEHSVESLNAMVYEHSTKEKHALGDFDYTNVGYNIYSVYADTHFGKPWQHRLQTEVFTPLSMTNTSATRTYFEGKQVNVAKPYSLMVAPLSEPIYLEKQDSTMHAAGGMYASTNDLARFVIAQLNKGIVGGEQVFPRKVIALSQQQQVKTERKYMDFKRDGYAWGWYTGEYKGERMLHHFGGFAGAHAHISFIPDKKIGLVVLNNEDFLSSKMTSLIADYVYGTLLNEDNVADNVANRFTKLNSKVANIDKMLAKQQTKIASRKMNLSLPVESYQGQYQHPLLGSIEVKADSTDNVTISWGVLQSKAQGFNKLDKIRVTLNPTSGEVITFTLDEAEKQIVGLTYDGNVFAKTKSLKVASLL